jgi:dihydrolipoamide dehydrogenase
MAESSYDCVVIGSGPGGYVAAVRAAQVGMKTAIVEKDKLGGRCLNYACIPAKAVLRSADILTEIREAGDYGLNVADVEVDFGAVAARRQKVVTTLTGGVGFLMKKNNVDVIEGEASLTADGKVVVADADIAAKAVILATGSVKRSIPNVEFGARILGTEETWSLEELPKRIAVIGAGASGTEIASAFARLGSEVLLFEALDRVLPTEDADISKLAGRGLSRQGIDVRTDTLVDEVEEGKSSVKFGFNGERAEVDYLVIATGRGPDIEALGLGAAGIELDDLGLIKVDGAMRTTRPGVWAIGDLVLGPALAHKASDEGIIAAEDAVGMETDPIAYEEVPLASF